MEKVTTFVLSGTDLTAIGPGRYLARAHGGTRSNAHAVQLPSLWPIGNQNQIPPLVMALPQTLHSHFYPFSPSFSPSLSVSLSVPLSLSLGCPVFLTIFPSFCRKCQHGGGRDVSFVIISNISLIYTQQTSSLAINNIHSAACSVFVFAIPNTL